MLSRQHSDFSAKHEVSKSPKGNERCFRTFPCNITCKISTMSSVAYIAFIAADGIVLLRGVLFWNFTLHFRSNLP